MKAIIFNNTGNAEEVLEIAEIEKPVPGPDEVLIKVLASPIHPADIMFIKGHYRYKPKFPQTAGLEGAGIIEAVGANINLKTGLLVAFMSMNSWAEYLKIRADEIVVLPDDFPVEKAAQFCLNPFTAYGLLDESKVKSGDWLLLTAANSAVSKIIIQLAAANGINTIALVRNIIQASELKKLGAGAVLSSDDDKLSEKILTLTGGKGLNAGLDAVGGKAGTMMLNNIAPNGTVLVYGVLSEDKVKFHNSVLLFKLITIKGFGIRQYLQNQQSGEKAEMLQVLRTEIADNNFKLPVEKTFPFEQFKEALHEESRNNRQGKIIFKN